MKVRDLLLRLADMELDLPVFIGSDNEYVTELGVEAKVEVENIEVGGEAVKAIVIEP